MAPGETARLTVSLRNTSDLVHHLQLEVRGLPPGARAAAEPPTVKLLPGATAQVALELHLPAAPPADAGSHVLGVLARSAHAREVSRCEEVRLDVPALPALAVTVEPELVRGGGRARFTATLANEGNTELRVALGGTDPERRVGFSVEPREVHLPPRRTAQAVVTVVADRPWTGQEARRPLTLTAQAGEVTASSTVTLVQPPRLPPVVLRSLAAVLGLVLLAGTIVLVDQLTGEQDGGAPDAQAAPSSPASAQAQPSAPVTASPTTSGASVIPSTAAPTPTPEPSTTATAGSSPSGPPSAPLPSVRPVPMTDGQAGPAVRLTDAPVPRLGFEVVAAPDATQPDCAVVERLAVHEAAAGDYVTAVDPAGGDLCRDVPLTVEFLEDVRPVTEVTLTVAADGDYRVTVTAPDGTSTPVTARARDRRIGLSSESVGALTLAADRTGSPPEVVGLAQVDYRPAPAS